MHRNSVSWQVGSAADNQVPFFLTVGDLGLLLPGHRIHIGVVDPSGTSAVGEINDVFPEKLSLAVRLIIEIPADQFRIGWPFMTPFRS